MMAFASLIPAVGTALIWVPAAIYLLISGHGGKAIFLSCWCAVVVGLVDNLLRPFLLRGKDSISSIYLFLAIMAGLKVFGIGGIVYGPLVVGVIAVLLYLYELEYQEVLQRP